MSSKVTAAQQQTHAHANAAQVKMLAERLCQADATRLDDSVGPYHLEEPIEAGLTKHLAPRLHDPVADVISPSSEGVVQLREK